MEEQPPAATVVPPLPTRAWKPLLPHWKRFRLMDVVAFAEHLREVGRSPGVAEEELTLYGRQEYLLNAGTLLQRVLKEYSVYLHPTLPRDATALWAALHDQLERCGVLERGTCTPADVEQRVRAHADTAAHDDCAWLLAASEAFDVVIMGVTYSHLRGLRGFRVASGARAAWMPTAWEGDREPRSLFLCHFGIHQWRSTLSLAETEALYEQVRGKPGLSNENWCPLLRRIGRYQDALECARAATLENPTSDVAESVWGGVMGDLFDHAAALEHHAKQVAINPKHEQSHNGLGCALHFLEDFVAAVPHYKAQLECNPLNMHSHRNLALAYEQLNRKEEALEMFEHEVCMYPDFRVAHRSYHLLLLDMCNSDLSRALGLYDELEKRCCDPPYFQALRAAVYIEMRDFPRALALLVDVVTNNCWDDFALGLLADVLQEMGHAPEAIAMLELIVHWTPEHGVAWESLGRMHRRQGNCKAAIEAYTTQLPVFIERYALYGNIAECYLELGKTDATCYDRAVEAARASLEIHPANVLASGAMGAALTALGKYEEAIEVYRKQLAFDKRKIAYSLYNIGLCLQRLGRHQESLHYFQEQLRAHPKDVLAMLQVGTEYWYLQDYHQSVAVYKAALELEPQHAQCAYFIADTLAAMGRYEEACEYYEIHERNAPDDTLFHLAWADVIGSQLRRLKDDPNRSADDDSLLVVLKRREAHHLQRYLGVPKSVACREEETAFVAPKRPHRDRFRDGLVAFVTEPSWPRDVLWSPARHVTLASHDFLLQTKSFLLVVLRFARERGTVFPKPLILHIVGLIALGDNDADVGSLAQRCDDRRLNLLWDRFWWACNVARALCSPQEVSAVVCGRLQIPLQTQAALDTLEELSTDPQFSFNVWNALGVLRCWRFDFIGAAAAFERQLEVLPTHRLAWCNLAFARACVARAAGKVGPKFSPVAWGKTLVDPVVVRSIGQASRMQLSVKPPVKHAVHVLLGLLEEQVSAVAPLHFARAISEAPWDDEVLLLWGRMERRAAENISRPAEKRELSRRNGETVLRRLRASPQSPCYGMAMLQLARLLAGKTGSEEAELDAGVKELFVEALRSDPRVVHKWWGLAEMARQRTVDALRHFNIQMMLFPLPAHDEMHASAVQLDVMWTVRWPEAAADEPLDDADDDAADDDALRL